MTQARLMLSSVRGCFTCRLRLQGALPVAQQAVCTRQAECVHGADAPF